MLPSPSSRKVVTYEGAGGAGWEASDGATSAANGEPHGSYAGGRSTAIWFCGLYGGGLHRGGRGKST